MTQVWVAADGIVSPLGSTSEENVEQLLNSMSGVSILTDPALSPAPIAAGKISSIERSYDQSRFEMMCIKAITIITGRFTLPAARTIFILSTTKGNISFLDEDRPDHKRIHLHATAAFLARTAGLEKYIVVSNACVSGVMAMGVAKRFLQSGQYDHALVIGADELSRFVVSGFQSLQALSDERCRPFDVNRKGINLGEAAGAILVTTKPEDLGVKPEIRILGFGLSNDANHISGPSRTGEELNLAIRQALQESKMTADEIDFVSAHGTATLYNDEMEAKAFTLAGLRNTPVNSLKAYYGHTLGAAGVVETIASIHSLLKQSLIPSLGFQQSGVSQPLNIIRKVERKPMKTFLKTASGFGGCNAAIVVQKTDE